jgi:hypothetical protein
VYGLVSTHGTHGDKGSGTVRALVARLERRLAFSVSVHDRELYVSVAADQIAGRVERLQRDV